MSDMEPEYGDVNLKLEEEEEEEGPSAPGMEFDTDESGEVFDPLLNYNGEEEEEDTYYDNTTPTTTSGTSKNAVATVDGYLDGGEFSGLKGVVDGLVANAAPALATAGSGLPLAVAGTGVPPAQYPSLPDLYQSLFTTGVAKNKMKAKVNLKQAREKRWPRNLGSAHGGRFAAVGKDSAGEKTGTYLRRPRSHHGERTEQILHQISVKLFDFAEESLTEVQTMMVDRRLIVSANESRGAALVRALQEEEFASLRDFLISSPESAGQRDRLGAARRVAMENIQQVAIELAPGRNEEPDDYSCFYSTNTTDGDREHLEQLFKIIRKNSGWATGGVTDAIAWLDRKDTKNGIFWCDPAQLGPDGTVHAEQALVIVLARSNRKGSQAKISGTMRPCVGCYLTFLYAINKLQVKVNVPVRPGGAWDGSQTNGFIQLVMSGADIDLTEIHDNWQAILEKWKKQGQPTKGRAAEKFKRKQGGLQKAFIEDIGPRWQAEVGKTFPLATYGTELPDDLPSDDEDIPRHAAPGKEFRRMRTMSETDMTRYLELRGITPETRGEKEQEEEEQDGEEEEQEEEEEDDRPVSSKRKRNESSSRSPATRTSRSQSSTTSRSGAEPRSKRRKKDNG